MKAFSVSSNLHKPVAKHCTLHYLHSVSTAIFCFISFLLFCSCFPEIPKTETNFEERLILKAFLLKFMNAYAPIFYVAFFKGRSVLLSDMYNVCLVFLLTNCGLFPPKKKSGLRVDLEAMYTSLMIIEWKRLVEMSFFLNKNMIYYIQSTTLNQYRFCVYYNNCTQFNPSTFCMLSM